jgi:hypothetical protein
MEKPAGDNGLINGGFFVLSPKVIDADRRRRHALGIRAARGPRARRRTDPPTAIAASGTPWTRCGTRTTWKSSGRRAARPGRSGERRRPPARSRLLARPPRPPDRPHRIQGKLGGAVAVADGRRGDRPGAAARHRAEPVRARRRRPRHRLDARRHARRRRGGRRGRGRARPQIVIHMAAQALVRRSSPIPSGPLPPMSWAPRTCSRRWLEGGRASRRSSSSPPTRSTPTPNGPRLRGIRPARRQGSLFRLQGGREMVGGLL